MKQNKKKIVAGFILVVSLFGLTACGENTNTSNNLPVSTSPLPSDTVENKDVTDTASPDVEETDNPNGKQISIYGMNEETLESEPANAVIEGEINAQSIVEAVVKEFDAHSVTIGIDKVTQEKDRVIVSFEKGKAPLAEVGSEVENTILNCISDSLMDNLETCKAVVYRANGEPYESGHFAFDLDEVYASE